MKKIEALKNKKTGDYPVIANDCIKINEGTNWYPIRDSLTNKAIGTYSKAEHELVKVILIEESELKEKIGEIQNELSMMVTMPNANEFDEGYIQASEEISKSVAKLLNSLTK